jgi:hypothetical protein
MIGLYLQGTDGTLRTNLAKLRLRLRASREQQAKKLQNLMRGRTG